MDIRKSDPDLESIARRLLSNEIDLQPDFQRQEVWSKSKKQKLIDTILRGWAIPPVHLVQNEETEDVLDGQQRLTAIRDFVEGKIKVNGFVAPENEDINALDGFRYDQLPSRVKRDFDRYTLRVYTLMNAKPQETAELSYRLNQPTALTSGEQRNALYGTRRTQMKCLVSEMDDLGYSLKSIGFSNSRLAYDDVIARVLVVLERGGLREKIGEAEISNAFRYDYPFESTTLQSVSKALALISNAFKDRQERLNKASLFSFIVAFSRYNKFDPENYTHAMNFLSKDGPANAERKTENQVYREVFLDRASSRVTDVASVILRDFCIVHSLNREVGGALSVEEPLLPQISRLVDNSSLQGIFIQDALTREVIDSNWGAAL